MSEPNFIVYTDIYKPYKKVMMNETNKVIIDNGKTKGKKYFELYYKEHHKPWFPNKNLKHELIVTINRCRSDHYNLAASLARVSIVKDPICPCLQNDQNLDHILWECSLYDKHRTKLIEELTKQNLQSPLSTTLLLSEPNTTTFSSILRFL